jgi:type I restriction-modification system DNA methylase subunit
MGKYCCAICDKVSNQKSHHEAHLESELHVTKVENFKLKMQHRSIYDIIKEYPKYLSDIPDDINEEVAAKCKFDLIEKIVVHKTTQIMEKINIVEYKMNSNISNKEALKEKIHEIHNFLRNNGAGYGMAALKVFNIFYGLKRIEENNLFNKLDLSEECKFSYLLEKSKEDDDELCKIIYDKVLGSLYGSKLKYFLFYEIPGNMKGIVFSHLINELDKLTDIEKSSGEQLTGKIYEYFIGRDKQAISELGAYFTNRLIVEYIYKQLDLESEEDGSIGTMVDPFGGSGGFTTGYINWMKAKNPDIDWSSEINKIHHYDMNEDVIKSAALEFFCITGEVPNMEHLQYKNSFTDPFNDQQFKYCITNPPYGGDKNKKSDAENKREFIKKYIKEELKTLTAKDIIKLRNEQLKHIDNLNKLDKKRQDEQKVTLDKSSKRIKKFAKKYGLNGNDKESVSLMLMMDMVEEGGTGCGVLKEGVFFNRTYKNLRKCLLENFNVTKVISIPSDQFENTSTKTSIVIFKNTEEKTTKVQFYDLSCVKFDKNKIEEINGHIVLTEYEGDVKGVEDKLVSVANIQEILNQKDVSLNGKVYTDRLFIPGDNYELYSLKDITSYQKGKPIKVKGENLSGDFGIVSGGGGICGWYHKYNRDENTILLSSSGNAGYVSRYPIKIWASDCWSIHSQDTEILTEDYLYYYLKIIQDIIYEYQTGSVIKHLKFEDIENLKISIPKDKQKMIEWSDKISEPYNENIDKQQKIKVLEKELQERVKTIYENEDCEAKTIEELCTLHGSGHYTKIGKKEGKYRFYNSSQNSKLYVDFCEFNELCIILGQGGEFNIHIDKNFTPSKHVCVLKLVQQNELLLRYIYYLIPIIKDSLVVNGSIMGWLNNSNIKKIKLKIPKNKQLIADMEQQFLELEQLHVDVKNADKKYKDLIEELRNEGIKQ